VFAASIALSASVTAALMSPTILFWLCSAAMRSLRDALLVMQHYAVEKKILQDSTLADSCCLSIAAPDVIWLGILLCAVVCLHCFHCLILFKCMFKCMDLSTLDVAYKPQREN